MERKIRKFKHLTLKSSQDQKIAIKSNETAGKVS